MNVLVLEPEKLNSLIQLPFSVHCKIFNLLSRSDVNAVGKSCSRYYRVVSRYRAKIRTESTIQGASFDILATLPFDINNIVFSYLSAIDLRNLLAIRSACVHSTVWKNYEINPLIITKRHLLPSFANEIVSLHVGHCGNKLGEHFWKQIMNEHALNEQGVPILTPLASYPFLRKARTYFHENKEGKFKPRALWIDLDPSILQYHSPSFSSLIGYEYIYGTSATTGFEWACGHFTEGAELVSQVTDQFRKLAEDCESIQGYQLFHSLGSGTGSGMGTLVISKLREEFPEVQAFSFSVFPSSNPPLRYREPYDVILGLNCLIEYAELCFLFDNGIMEGGAETKLNSVFSEVCSMVTGPLRFPGIELSNMRKMTLNLVPRPTLHFLYSQLTSKPIGNDLQALISAPDCQAIKMNSAKELSNYGFFSVRNLSSAVPIIKDSLTIKPFHQIPNSWAVQGFQSFNSQPLICTTFNGSGVLELFNRHISLFSDYFKRKAFLHHVRVEGLDEVFHSKI